MHWHQAYPSIAKWKGMSNYYSRFIETVAKETRKEKRSILSCDEHVHCTNSKMLCNDKMC